VVEEWRVKLTDQKGTNISPRHARGGTLGSALAARVGALLVFLIPLLVYLRTMAPTVVFVDSGELILAARALGVAHPPGFPLYILLTHLATLLPFGEVAQRVNFASALFAALAVGMLALAFNEALQSRAVQRTAKGAARGHKKQTRKASPPSGQTDDPVASAAAWPHLFLWLTPGWVAALLLAFSRTFWSFATVAEVYTLNTLLLVITIFLMFRWRREQVHDGSRSDHFLYAAALVFGLALGVHHITVAVTLPALAVLVYRTSGWPFFKSRRLLYAALLAFAGLVLVYAYLPLAASRSPLMNWGDPRNLQRLWWHVSGRQYQVFISFSAGQIAGQAAAFLRLASHEFGPPWLPLAFVVAVLGLWELWRLDRANFWFLTLVIAGDLAYSLNYEIAEDKGAYYLPAFVATALAAGFGVRAVLRWTLPRFANQHLVMATAVICALLPAATLAANFASCNRHNFFLARDYVNNLERAIAPHGMLLTGDWQVYSPLLYEREVQQQRRDVVAIDVNMLRRSWYYEYLGKEYPDLLAATRPQVESFLADLRRWEQDPEVFARSPALTTQINDHFYAMILAFVSAYLRTAPVYVTWDVGIAGTGQDAELAQSLNQSYQLVPQGLVFQLFSDREFHPPAPVELVTRGLRDGSFSFDDDDVVMLKVFPVYVNMLVNQGKYLAAYGHFQEAIQCYRRALALAPDSASARQAIDETQRALRSPG
jgi:tetratricopeptide (TPR) repeat protein